MTTYKCIEHILIHRFSNFQGSAWDWASMLWDVEALGLYSSGRNCTSCLARFVSITCMLFLGLRLILDLHAGFSDLIVVVVLDLHVGIYIILDNKNIIYFYELYIIKLRVHPQFGSWK